MHPAPRTFHVIPTMIRGSHRIPDSAYTEVVYVQPPPEAVFDRNNTFFNVDPSARFIKKFKQTDPIHGAHSHLWGKLGDYVHISAQARAIHIRFLKKSVPDRIFRILVSRLMEHAASNQVINPRLLNVQKRGGEEDFIVNAKL